MVSTLFSHSCFRVPEVLMEKLWSVGQPPGLQAIFHFSSVSPYVTFTFSRAASRSTHPLSYVICQSVCHFYVQYSRSVFRPPGQLSYVICQSVCQRSEGLSFIIHLSICMSLSHSEGLSPALIKGQLSCFICRFVFLFYVQENVLPSKSPNLIFHQSIYLSLSLPVRLSAGLKTNYHNPYFNVSVPLRSWAFFQNTNFHIALHLSTNSTCNS